MRRFAAIAVIAIGGVFLASLVVLDRLDGAEPPSPSVVNREEPLQAPAPTIEPPVRAPTPSPEAVRQMASPPADPVPALPPDPLPPSGAPPVPVYVRQELGALEARIVSRCGSMTLRLGDQLRKEGLGPNGHAVLLLDVEPQEGQVKVWGATLQSPGFTRPALVACAQHTLRGHTFDVGSLRPGARFKVQLVVGVRE